MIQGCRYREALQAVRVTGGVAGNVVPDTATVTLNRRFAPDRTEQEAADEVRTLLSSVLEDGDEVVVVDSAPAAAPGLDNPILRSLVDDHGLTVTAKLGWTDVARFAAIGVPACNLGPGDASLAHTADERVDRGLPGPGPCRPPRHPHDGTVRLGAGRRRSGEGCRQRDRGAGQRLAHQGSPSSPPSAAAANASAVMPGTSPRTVRWIPVMPSPGWKVTSAVVSSVSGGVPALASALDRAIEKHDESAAPMRLLRARATGRILGPRRPGDIEAAESG